MSDADLLARALAGHPGAMGDLWALHRRWVAAILLAHGPREAELDDLLQEVAVVLVQRLSTLDDPAALRPWLRAVALNVARMAGRRATGRRRRERPLAPVDEQLPDEVQSRRDAARLSLDAVLDAMRRLPGDYREPLLLRTVDGLGQVQIAETLELPVTTVETRLARARAMLRRVLAERAAARGEEPPGEGAPVRPEASLRDASPKDVDRPSSRRRPEVLP